MSIQMTVDIAVRKPDGKGFYSTSIDLPALNLELEDAKQRVRLCEHPEAETFFSIYESVFGSMENVSMEGTSLEELNYLARRLDSLPVEELYVFSAVYQSRVESVDDCRFSVKDIINMTYGLDAVPIASNVSNDDELGRFVFENSFDERFDDLPESMLKYLDYKLIGKEFRERDDGVFIGKLYIPTREYEQREVYDGRHIPVINKENTVVKPEKYELIEIIGKPSLFSDARIPDSAVPEGLYRYDLRCGDNDYIDGTIEPNVYVDHGGSVLMREPIDFGESGYIQLDEDSSPNFTGEEMTAEKFAAADFDEDYEQNGGMSL